MTPRIGASGAARSTAIAPGLDCPGVKPVPRTGASEAKEIIRLKGAPEWSVRDGTKHGTSSRTGSFGGEPGATGWNVRGNGKNKTKRRPGLEHPGRKEARPEPGDWIVRGCGQDCSVRGNGENTLKRRPGLEHPGRKEARH